MTTLTEVVPQHKAHAEIQMVLADLPQVPLLKEFAEVFLHSMSTRGLQHRGPKDLSFYSGSLSFF